jgi:magnesium chelatase family protein
MRVEVGSVPEETLTSLPDGEPTRFVAERVRKAYDRAIARQGRVNDHLQGAELEEACALDEPVQKLLHAASVRLGWSARAYHRVLKVARTIADLADSERLETHHVAEAIQYRRSLRDN